MRLVVVDPGQQVPYYDRELASALAAQGADVTLAIGPMRHYDPGPVHPGVTVRYAFGKLLNGPMARAMAVRPGLRRTLRAVGYVPELTAFVRWVATRRPDVVHLQWSLAPSLDAWAMARFRRAGAAVVYTAHNVLPHERRPWLAAGSFRALCESTDRIVVHSAASRDRLLSNFPRLRRPDVSVIPIAAAAQAGHPARGAARAALGLPEHRPIVMFFGHVRHYKGIDLLLDAAVHSLGTVPQGLLLLAGPVAGGRRAAEALRAAAAARLPEGAFELRDGYVRSEDVAAMFGAADVVALPYRDTDDSAVLAEARSYGRAVVATAVGGLPEALASGGGLLVPPADPASFGEALARILGDPELKARLEAEAIAAARAWTWPDAARRHLEIYHAAVAERARAPAVSEAAAR